MSMSTRQCTSREGSLDELYLIAHRVRGEVAYDIAERLLLSSGQERWLIPTSGHRAYPLRTMRLDESLALTLSAEELASVPDHYPPKQSLLARVRARLRRPRLTVLDAQTL
jgi:hypothetical protein